MSTELTTNPWQVLEKLSSSGQSVENLREIMNMAMEWDALQAKKTFAEALRLFQSKCPAIEKKAAVPDKAGNTKYKFATYEEIMTVVQPILAECQIVPTFSFEYRDKLLVTSCHLHVGTHIETTTLPLGIPDIPGANETQKGGGAQSYGKRYSLVAALNIRIIGEDNDAADLVGYISAEEVEMLNSMVKEVGFLRDNPMDVPGLLNWLVPGLDKLEEVPSNKLSQLVMEINRKRKAAIIDSRKKGSK